MFIINEGKNTKNISKSQKITDTKNRFLQNLSKKLKESTDAKNANCIGEKNHKN